MKVIGIANDTYQAEYICTVTHNELEKFLALYYGKMQKLKIGEAVDLGKGYDYAGQIADAMKKTQDFVQANQTVVTAILNGLNYASISALKPPQSDGEVKP